MVRRWNWSDGFGLATAKHLSGAFRRVESSMRGDFFYRKSQWGPVSSICFPYDGV